MYIVSVVSAFLPSVTACAVIYRLPICFSNNKVGLPYTSVWLEKVTLSGEDKTFGKLATVSGDLEYLHQYNGRRLTFCQTSAFL